MKFWGFGLVVCAVITLGCGGAEKANEEAAVKAEAEGKAEAEAKAKAEAEAKAKAEAEAKAKADAAKEEVVLIPRTRLRDIPSATGTTVTKWAAA